MFDPLTIAVAAAAFLIAGTVKGVIGLGLPIVSLGLLTVALDLPTAMALLVVPSVVTNIWQAAVGGHAGVVFRRIWPFLLAAVSTVWVGAMALTVLNLALLSALLGAVLIIYAALNLSGFRIAISPRREVLAGPALGVVNGLITGMTGASAVPGVLYLQAIGLPRDMLIQAMGMLFGVSTTALAVALKGNNLLTPDLAIASAFALLPSILGMMAGQRIRKRLSEDRFRHVSLIAILALGIYIVATAALGNG